MADLNPDFPSGLLVFVLLVVFGSFALFATHNHKQTLRFQLKIFLCAFALRFALSVLIYQFGLVRVLGDEDAAGFRGAPRTRDARSLPGKNSREATPSRSAGTSVESSVIPSELSE